MSQIVALQRIVNSQYFAARRKWDKLSDLTSHSIQTEEWGAPASRQAKQEQDEAVNALGRAIPEDMTDLYSMLSVLTDMLALERVRGQLVNYTPLTLSARCLVGCRNVLKNIS